MDEILELLNKSRSKLGYSHPSIRLFSDWSGSIIGSNDVVLFSFGDKQELIDYLKSLNQKKEMTVSEIEKELGYEIKIIK